jgi:hypothetical protein
MGGQRMKRKIRGKKETVRPTFGGENGGIQEWRVGGGIWRGMQNGGVFRGSAGVGFLHKTSKF